MADTSCAELIKEAAKIIFQVHDEVSDHGHRSGAGGTGRVKVSNYWLTIRSQVKDKMFELELSWV